MGKENKDKEKENEGKRERERHPELSIQADTNDPDTKLDMKKESFKNPKAKHR